MDIRVFDPQDYGVPTLGLTYLVHSDTLKEDPQLVERFLLETDLKNAARPDGIGRGTARQWQVLADLLNGYGVLARPVDATQAFNGTIVDGLYRRDQIR